MPALSPQEFASRIKAKYPAYKNVDDTALVQALIKKYPVYSSQVDFNSTETNSEAAGKTIAKGLVKAVNPANLIENAKSAIPFVMDKVEKFTEDTASPTPEQEAETKVAHEKATNDSIRATQDANAAGIIPSGIDPKTKMPPTPERIQAKIDPLHRIGSAINEVAQVPGKVVNQVVQDTTQGITQGVGEISDAGKKFGNAITGIGDEGEQLEPGERGLQAGEAALQTVHGTLQSLFAAPGAVVHQIPGVNQVVQAASGLINGMGQGGSDLFKSGLSVMGGKLSPEQEQQVDEGFKSLASLLVIKFSHDAAKYSKHQQAMDDAISAYKDAQAQGNLGAANIAMDKITELVAQKPTFGENLAGNVVGGAKDVLNKVIPKNIGEMQPPPPTQTNMFGPGAQKNPQPDMTPENTKAELNTKDIKPDLLRSNMVNERDANLLSNLDPKGRKIVNDYLDQGNYKLQNPSSGETMFDTPGREVEEWLGKAEKVKQQLGQKVSTAKLGLSGTEVSTDPVMTTFLKELRRFNISQSIDDNGMKLDYGDSDLANVTQAQNLFNDIYKKLQSPTLDARDLESVTSQIDQASGLLKSAGYKPSVTNNAFSEIKSTINKTVGEQAPEFATANKDFAQFMEDYKTIDNAATVKLGNGQEVWSGAQLLRRLTGNAGAKYKAALESMQNLESNYGDDYGLLAPENLKLKADLANFVEKFTQTGQPGSLGGQAQAAAENAVGKVPVVGQVLKTARAVADYMNPPEVIKENISKLKFIMNGSGDSPVYPPVVIGKDGVGPGAELKPGATVSGDSALDAQLKALENPVPPSMNPIVDLAKKLGVSQAKIKASGIDAAQTLDALNKGGISITDVKNMLK